MECDFCSSRAVVKKYECHTFDSSSERAAVEYGPCRGLPLGGTLTLHSIDFWAACAPCSELIERRDIDGLVKRALDCFGGRLENRYYDELVAHLTLTYAKFFENRKE